MKNRLLGKNGCHKTVLKIRWHGKSECQKNGKICVGSQCKKNGKEKRKKIQKEGGWSIRIRFSMGKVLGTLFKIEFILPRKKGRKREKNLLDKIYLNPCSIGE